MVNLQLLLFTDALPALGSMKANTVSVFFYTRTSQHSVYT